MIQSKLAYVMADELVFQEGKGETGDEMYDDDDEDEMLEDEEIKSDDDFGGFGVEEDE